jgi:hypothetical protein
VSVREEELMALYGIAKDEIDGVTKVCQRLEKAIQQLERVDETIGMYAHRGIGECLNDFKSKYSLTLSQEVKDVTMGLRIDVMNARNALGRQEKLYWVIFFFVGMFVGVFGLWWWTSERFHDMEIGQEALYNKIESLRHPVKPKKVQVKHRRVGTTQSSEESNDGESSAGGEGETK